MVTTAEHGPVRTIAAAVRGPVWMAAAAALFALVGLLAHDPGSALATRGPAPRALIVGERPSRSTDRVRVPPVRAEAIVHAGGGFASAPSPHGRPVVRMRTVHLRRGESLRAGLARARRRRDVVWARPDYLARAAGGPFYPDDRGRTGRAGGWARTQWNLLDRSGIDAPLAWSNLLADHRAGGSGVRIAVLDTGVAYRNWRGFRRSPDLRRDAFVDPYDFVAHDREPLDRDGHGTFVASVIAEATNNRIGLTGVAYGASIMPVRVLGTDGLGSESTIAAGIRYAVAHHAQIINLSLEFLPGEVQSARQVPEIAAAVRDARRHGVLVVAAAGNDDQGSIAAPADVPGVLAVGATTKDSCRASYSNTGRGLALVAPGGGSDALMPSDPACHPGRDLPSIHQMTLSDPRRPARFGYPGFYVGTSIAAPEVTGTAALVIASGVIGRHPTPDAIRARLEQTATPLPVGGHQPNDDYGWGLVDAGLATSPLVLPARGASSRRPAP